MRQVALWLGILTVFFSAGRGFALSEDERDERINDFTAEILESFGTDRESVVKALGTPMKDTVEKHENRHEAGVEDTIETLEYEGLSLTLGTMSSEKRRWALALFCSSDRYALRNVRVGDPVDKVLKALGDPAERTAEKVAYGTDYTSLTLTVDAEGTIKEIEALLWLD
ncbi:MAG: hypothetical protein Q4A13_04210 [Fretibacterium sp.]|nr:hypothetical protein [Fretibacterium sp.]